MVSRRKSFITSTPTEELLQRPPESRSAPLINFKMWKMIFGQAFYQVAIGLTLLVIYKYKHIAYNMYVMVVLIMIFYFFQFAGPALFQLHDLQNAGGIIQVHDGTLTNAQLQKQVLRTIIFNTFVLMQVFNEIK